MINKQVELTLSGQKIQLWFNTFSKYELMGMYQADNEIEFAEKMSDRAKENALLLLMDIVKAGIKGASLAKGETTPEIYNNINMVFAEMPMEDTLTIWTTVFKSFNEHMGMNVKEDKKKEAPTAKNQNPQPVTKMS